MWLHVTGVMFAHGANVCLARAVGLAVWLNQPRSGRLVAGIYEISFDPVDFPAQGQTPLGDGICTSHGLPGTNQAEIR